MHKSSTEITWKNEKKNTNRKLKEWKMGKYKPINIMIILLTMFKQMDKEMNYYKKK